MRTSNYEVRIPKPKRSESTLKNMPRETASEYAQMKKLENPVPTLAEKDKYDFNGYGMSERSLGGALLRYFVEDENASKAQ